MEICSFTGGQGSGWNRMDSVQNLEEFGFEPLTMGSASNTSEGRDGRVRAHDNDDTYDIRM